MGGSSAPMPYQPAHSAQVDNALAGNIALNTQHTGMLYDYAQPQYESLYNQTKNNPGNATATATGQDIYQRGTAAGNNELSRGYQMAGLAPGAIQSGWDPQSANMNWGLGQVQGAANVNAAESGLAGSPFGAGATNNATADFMRQWMAGAQERQGEGINQLSQINSSANASMGEGLKTITDSGLMPQAIANDQTAAQSAALNQLVQGLSSITSSSNQTSSSADSYLNTGVNASNAATNATNANNATTNAFWGAVGSAAGLAASFA